MPVVAGLLGLALLCGCTTLDPNTGRQVHDPVKTEKVRAVLKPLVSGAVSAVIAKNPEATVYFDQAAGAICQMRDSRQVNVETFRARLLGILDQHVGARVDPLVRTTFLTLIALFEINFADRLQADLPPEEFVWNLLDVLCDGIPFGMAGAENTKSQTPETNSCSLSLGLWTRSVSPRTGLHSVRVRDKLVRTLGR